MSGSMLEAKKGAAPRERSSSLPKEITQPSKSGNTGQAGSPDFRDFEFPSGRSEGKAGYSNRPAQSHSEAILSLGIRARRVPDTRPPRSAMHPPEVVQGIRSMGPAPAAEFLWEARV